MNGNRIALVLGLAGLAGLGLATPGMLGAGAKPEPAPVPLPAAESAAAAVAAPAVCALEPGSVHLEALIPECEPAAQTTRIDLVAAAEPTAQVPIQTLHAGAILYPVARPVSRQVTGPFTGPVARPLDRQVVRPPSVFAGVPKNAAMPERSQMLLKQRKALGKQLSGGKALPAGQSMKAAAIVPGEALRGGSSQEVSSSASGARSGADQAEPVRPPLRQGSATRVPIEKLAPPK